MPSATSSSLVANPTAVEPTLTLVRTCNLGGLSRLQPLVPRYFFDLYNDVDSVDHEGKELSGLEAATDNALVEAREMMTQAVHEGKLNLNHYIEVRDEAGDVVHVLHFGDAVQVTAKRA